ncbi:MAG TPA: 16S rRNA (adenine(1518)-N(6)/adenine(1519)-N(6))-dimethyltransferase RsmA [Flavobacteriales bacterium]|nr:16S rRNA (adenine(1518)-N(6)/adenine(1519)-N(6))-dimethyltransferase RsmA [Flavobacteriales bacterium]HNU55383.1 16S rRNA (adenine(1518)-N(6)/adenine(1519)-N(6))-dimethyltransferase RsmA [Flavobacteriales bacterium]
MNVRAKKHLGQHFLKEEAIAQRIAESLTGHGGYHHVIEVGPGTGALTKHLVHRRDTKLVCYEVDTESVRFLEAHFPELEVRESDFLRMDPDSVTTGPIAVIGNFPYNISTQIVFKILEHRDRFPEMVGMFQKEVADRICTGPGSRTYGITSVLAQVWYDMEMLFTVEREAFIPPPEVRSAVMRMKRNTVMAMPCDEGRFTRLVKAAFNQRRKTLNNALKGFPGLEAGVPAPYGGERAERLSVQDFIQLTLASEG